MEIQMWKEILTPYDLAVEELQVKFNHIIKEYRQAGVYSPIEQVLGRVKSISSILLKAQKHNIDLNEIEGHILDIAGIRLICQAISYALLIFLAVVQFVIQLRFYRLLFLMVKLLLMFRLLI